MSVRMGVENINAVMDLEMPLDIELISAAFGDSKKHILKSGNLSYRIKKPKASIEIFPSGKITLSGLINIGDIGSAKAIIMEDLASAGIVPTAPVTPKIYNIVASGDLGMCLDLPKVFLQLETDKTEYEPEQFPGIIYKLDRPKVTVLIFNTGKIICTGASDPKDILEASDIVNRKILDIVQSV